VNVQDDDGHCALHHALQIQIQHLFSFTFVIDDQNYECFTALLLAGADVTLANADGDTPLDLLSEAAGCVFSFLSHHPALFSFPSPFTTLMRMNQQDASRLSGDAPFAQSLALFQLERKEQEEEQERRGACPFIDVTNTKVRRKKPVPQKYIRPPSSPSPSPSFSPFGPSSQGGAKCPYGFGGQESQSSSTGKCPMGFQSSGSSDVMVSVPPPSRCPFHVFVGHAASFLLSLSSLSAVLLITSK
jgi:hypothetical protein